MNEKIKAAMERASQLFCHDWPVDVYGPSDLTVFYEKGAIEWAKKWEESHGKTYFECREEADRLLQSLLGEKT